jgi:predicted ATPase/DNA-binding winged helix-turn-helix (wHTH) protein
MTIVQFGRFRLVSQRRELLANGVPVPLGGRALDVLIVLIEARGELVTKDEFLDRVWPGTMVEENALQVQVSTLRRALGPDRDFIKTISGRGYRFVACITTPTAPEEVPSESGAAFIAQRSNPTPPTNLPASISDLVGREAQLSDLADLVAAHRLVTMVGVGGIGKTRLGLELGRYLLPKFADGVWVAELGPLSDPELVLPTVGTLLGLAGGPDSPERLATALASAHLLLILDNCEHVIDAAARIAEAFLHASATLRVLATSREPLRAEGECVYRVPALDVPAEGTDETEEMLRHSALQLFVVRARAAEPRFSLDARSGAAVAKICRHLDGIPLAIELAAARAAALGVEGLASRLDDRFSLLTDGLRTALPRHQTLRATLDWSYELLSEHERVVMRRLAIFAAGFTTEAASSVAASDEIATSDIVRCLANLVTKSLVTSDAGSAMGHYRLLETMRAYAIEKLTESGEFEPVARHHAEYFQDLFEQAEAEWETRPTAEWLLRYGWQIANVRAALDWAFDPSGDAMIGVALTVATTPLWFQLSLINECRERVEQALAALEPGLNRGGRREMQLYAALGWSLMYTTDPARETGSAWTTALALAEQFDDTDYQLRAFWGLWAGRVNNGEFREALALAQRFHNLAASVPNPDDTLIGDRMIGASLHFLGDQAGARLHTERMLKGYVTPTRRSDAVRFQFDQRVTAHITLARTLWLQGFADQAMRDVESNIEHALSINHTLSLCNALAQAACPIALLAGELSAAERFIAMLLHHAERHSLDVWHAYGRCFKGDLLLRRGDVAGGLQLLRTAVDELRQARFVQYHTAFLRALAGGFAAAGQAVRGLDAINEALAQSEPNGERWCVAELLRIKGDLVLLNGGRNAVAAAEDLFADSLAWGRRQALLSWELRTSIGLARLWCRQGRTQEAHDLLASVYSRFTEGFETADLLSAKKFLDELA